MKTITTNIMHTFSLKQLVIKKHIALLTIFGSFLIVLGTVLPWVTVLGGLQSFAGIAGLNGRILLVSGVISLVAGIIYFAKPVTVVSWGIGLFGFFQLAFCSWLLLGLWKTYQQITQDSMVIGGIGPGLFVVTLGALLIFGTLVTNRK